MSVNIIPHIFPQRRPRRARTNPVRFDPLRRLAAAVALQAVVDVLYPRQSTTQAEQFDAMWFISSDDGQYILSQFIGPEKARLLREVTRC